MRNAIFKAARRGPRNAPGLRVPGCLVVAGLVLFLAILGPQGFAAQSGAAGHAIGRATAADNAPSTLEFHDSALIALPSATLSFVCPCAGVAHSEQPRAHVRYLSQPLSVRPPPQF